MSKSKSKSQSQSHSPAQKATRAGQDKEYNAYSPDMNVCPICDWNKDDFCKWYQAAYTVTSTSSACAWPWHVKLCGCDEDSGNAANPTEEEKRNLPKVCRRLYIQFHGGPSFLCKVARELKQKAGWKTKPLSAHGSPRDHKRKLRPPVQVPGDSPGIFGDVDASDEEYRPPQHSVKRPKTEKVRWWCTCGWDDVSVHKPECYFSTWSRAERSRAAAAAAQAPGAAGGPQEERKGSAGEGAS